MREPAGSTPCSITCQGGTHHEGALVAAAARQQRPQRKGAGVAFETAVEARAGAAAAVSEVAEVVGLIVERISRTGQLLAGSTHCWRDRPLTKARGVGGG